MSDNNNSKNSDFNAGNFWLHRTLCDSLQESREVLKKLSFYNRKRCKAILESLVEEQQVYANRMEAGLGYGSDLDELHKKRRELIAECKKLHKERVRLDVKPTN